MSQDPKIGGKLREETSGADRSQAGLVVILPQPGASTRSRLVASEQLAPAADPGRVTPAGTGGDPPCSGPFPARRFSLPVAQPGPGFGRVGRAAPETRGHRTEARRDAVRMLRRDLGRRRRWQRRSRGGSPTRDNGPVERALVLLRRADAGPHHSGPKTMKFD